MKLPFFLQSLRIQRNTKKSRRNEFIVWSFLLLHYRFFFYIHLIPRDQKIVCIYMSLIKSVVFHVYIHTYISSLVCWRLPEQHTKWTYLMSVDHMCFINKFFLNFLACLLELWMEKNELDDCIKNLPNLLRLCLIFFINFKNECFENSIEIVQISWLKMSRDEIWKFSLMLSKTKPKRG